MMSDKMTFHPRYRKPSIGELLGTTKVKRRVSRKYHLRAITDPLYPVKNAERRAKRKVGYYSGGAKARGFCSGYSANRWALGAGSHQVWRQLINSPRRPAVYLRLLVRTIRHI
jgi:hypothetical protein